MDNIIIKIKNNGKNKEKKRNYYEKSKNSTGMNNSRNQESIKKNQKHALQEYGQKKHKTFQEKKRSLKKILIFETY